MEDADVAAVVAQAVFCTAAITMENVGQTPLFLRRLINSVRSSSTQDERGTILPTPSFPLTSNFHFRQHELLFLLISTTPSFFPSFLREQTPMVSSPSLYIIPLVSQSVRHSRLLLPPDHVRVPRRPPPPVCKGFRGSSPQQQP